MRGIGGPLLCISDLLNDVGEENPGVPLDHASPLDAADVTKLPVTELPELFRVHFNELKGALEDEGHSWTALTLELCSALETGLYRSSLSEKVEELERIVKRRDSAIGEANAIQGSHRL